MGHSVRRWLALLVVLFASLTSAQAQNFGNIPGHSVIGNPTPNVGPARPFDWDALPGGSAVGGRPGLNPMGYGCVGDGNADDTACVQAAIDAAATLGVPLYFDSAHLYNITHSLNITASVMLWGPFRYGIWPVITCPWGLVTKNTGITMLNITAETGTIEGICIDMTGNNMQQPSSGTAIQLAPVDINHGQSGWHIERNTILAPYTGITFNGVGPAPTQCCGAGTSADGIVASYNTIVDPRNAAIEIGKNTVYAASVGITLVDNNIVCGKWGLPRGKGLVVYDGGPYYDGSMNGPEGCSVGVEIVPAYLNSSPQWVQFYGDGVMGDQSSLHDLWVHPGNGGWISPLRIGGKGAWANQTGIPNANQTSVLIDCTAPTESFCDGIQINNMIIFGGTGQNSPIFDVEAGPGGPINFMLTNSSIRQGGTGAVGGGNAVALKLNFLPGGAYAGNWTVVGNQINSAALGCCQAPGGVAPIGLQLITQPTLSSEAVMIANNNFTNSDNLPSRPIAYAPAVNDHVMITNNLGVNDANVPLTAAATVALVDAYESYEVLGSAAIQTINGAWSSRFVRFNSDGSGINLTAAAGGAGQICQPSVAAAQAVELRWLPGGTCWVHIP